MNGPGLRPARPAICSSRALGSSLPIQSTSSICCRNSSTRLAGTFGRTGSYPSAPRIRFSPSMPSSTRALNDCPGRKTFDSLPHSRRKRIDGFAVMLRTMRSMPRFAVYTWPAIATPGTRTNVAGRLSVVSVQTATGEACSPTMKFPSIAGQGAFVPLSPGPFAIAFAKSAAILLSSSQFYSQNCLWRSV